jgi:transcriptional regulator with XRE-family HTH domain
MNSYQILVKTSATNLCPTGRLSLNLIKSVKTDKFKMDSLGDTIRRLREDNELPLRAVAAFLEIDQTKLSKLERGNRKPAREQVMKLAGYFKVKENNLLIACLNDKLVYESEDEDIALKALQVAEEKVKYITKNKGKK